jgi:hypothetical protein
MIGMPRFGAVEMGAAIAYCAPNTHADIDEEAKVDVVAWQTSCTSSTTNAMNQILAKALDYRDDGFITHLAMIHADVEPEGPWTNILWNEQRLHGDVVTSAVIAIKDNRLRSSTAIGDVSDDWKVNAWIGLGERGDIPDTFGTEDVCEPGECLLVNTGLMLMDLRWPGWDDFSFQWYSRIEKWREGEEWGRRTDFRPEDWEMSRYLHRHGARYHATFKVPAVHVGNGRWPNQLEDTIPCQKPSVTRVGPPTSKDQDAA